MKKEIIQIQFAWFFSNEYFGNFEEISLKLKNILGESKQTQILPLPNEAPSEIPRLILIYENFNINFSKNRADLFLKDIVIAKDIIPKINNLLNVISLLAGRIGFVKSFFLEGNVSTLKKLLSKSKIETLVKEISIRINKEKIIEGYKCNNTENISNGSVIKKEKDGSDVKKEGIIVIRDINTLAEEIKNNKFDTEIINKIVDSFNIESDNFILIRE